jgi:hypothetical protein
MKICLEFVRSVAEKFPSYSGVGGIPVKSHEVRTA